MNLIFYMPSKNTNTRRLVVAVEKLDLDAGLELHFATGSLFRRLCQPAREIAAGVLVATRREDFDKIFVLKELLVDIPVVIVLPCGQDDLVPRAHLMRPRFVSFWDQCLREVPAVLVRMLDRYQEIDVAAKPSAGRSNAAVRRSLRRPKRKNRA